MRSNFFEIIATFIVIQVSRGTNCETIGEISKDKPIDFVNGNSTVDPLKSTPCKGKKCLNYWVSTMGVIQSDLMGVQALIIKDEALRGACDHHDRKSKTKFLMCTGSILNRNHVLTSATCLHKATHIKHNIRGTLAVAIAPLKPSIQIIRVLEYKIHPRHDANPFSSNHLIHNVAVLKLGCRIDMENFHKIELPKAPFVHTCSEENCMIAVYRKVNKNNWVVYQTLTPHVPLPNRRRKQTMIKDGESKKNQECRKNETITYENYRSKRKMAEHPTFVRRHESRWNNEKSNDSTSGMSILTTSEDSLIEATTMDFDEMENSSLVKPNSLKDDEDWLRPVGEKRIKSLVARSSNGFRACAQTGSPIMYNKTQAAIASVPCDDRQPSSKWGYTDLFPNLDFLQDIVQDWTGQSTPTLSPNIGEHGKQDSGAESGNFSRCSTCIFNFFIEIGCKDKNQCGNTTGMSGQSDNLLDPQQTGNSMGARNQQGCSGPNTVGIEIGIGQGCDKKNEKIDEKPAYRQNWQKSMNPQVQAQTKPKNFALANNDANSKESVTSGPLKTGIVKDQRGDKNKYPRKDGQSVSQLSRRISDRPADSASSRRNYKQSKGDNKNRERVTNEIALQNIEGDSTDWLSEVEKELELNSDVKGELTETRRNS